MTAISRKYEMMSLDDFEELALDMPADGRWELIGGRVVRGVVGARWEHNRIIQNLASALLIQLRKSGSDCRPYVETFWLKEKSLDMKVLPDLMVRSGPLEQGATDLSDPVVIVEVVSPGSESRDRFEKWSFYQQIPSMKHYVLAARDQPHVEVFTQSDKGWSGYQVIEGLDQTLSLPAIGFETPLSDVYCDVFETSD